MAKPTDFISGGVSGAVAMAPLGPVPAVIGGVGGGLLGLLAGSERDKNEAAVRAAMQENAGRVASAQMTPEQATPRFDYEYVTPDMLYQDPASAYVYADPEAVQAQYAALDQLQQWGQGGLTQTDMSNLQMSQMQNAQQERAQREAYMNQMQQRGMGGSGAEMASVMSGMQNMTNANALEAISMQAAAQDRALRATEGAANLSSGLRSSSFGEAQDRANAWDQFNAANTDYRRQVQGNNVDRFNQGEVARAQGNESIYNQAMNTANAAAGVPAQTSSTYGDLAASIANAADYASSHPELFSSSSNKKKKEMG